MELIRPIGDYPWRRIVGIVCIAMPLFTTVYLWPDWQAAHASTAIAMWLDGTLRMSALALSFDRSAVTALGRAPIENGFQLFALCAPTFLDTAGVRTDLDANAPVWEVLLTDRGGLTLSLAPIAVTLGFIAVARYRRPARSVRLA